MDRHTDKELAFQELEKAIEERRLDPDFYGRLRQIVREDEEILRRLKTT